MKHILDHAASGFEVDNMPFLVIDAIAYTFHLKWEIDEI